MLHLFFPIGDYTGWDTCGKYLTIELSKLGKVTVVTQTQITPNKMVDELEHFVIAQTPINTINGNHFDQKNSLIKGVSIRMLNDFDLSLWIHHIKSEKIIGYTFYYGSPLSKDQLDEANRYDLIVAGSSYCESRLNDSGLKHTKTIIQGVNPQIFNPIHSSKSLLRDRFVIFSGGKLEFRKSQDIVIRAFKIFSDRYPDTLLVNSWFNQWDFSLHTMSASALIDFQWNGQDYISSMNNLFKMNGINPELVITLPIKAPFQLAYIYKNTDIGLFPNRCEGGTNLMLMEYMACGKPVIASSNTGHADIVNNNNAFEIKTYHPVKATKHDPAEYNDWSEPDIEEIVAHLEMAYNDNKLRKQKGETAGKHLAGLTWRKASREFHATAEEYK